MAMLAEPRQRKRYNLMPKGKALYEDESRFGTKMLERMGWKKGEGLGATSDGSKDFVRIRFKNDAFGLGFEQRDDQWTQHEQSFNGLLKTLNNEEIDVNRNKENEGVNDHAAEMSPRVGFGFQEETKSESKKLKEKISGISLEERSKQSKARVHYKKFTKGKDLSQYSEKDLANIFGKKAVAEDQVDDFYKNLSNTFGVIAEESSSSRMDATVNDLQADSEDSATKKKDKKKKKKNQDKEMEKKNEVDEAKQNTNKQTFTSNLSVQDYFKMKMEAIRNKKAEHDNSGKVLNNAVNPCNDKPEAELTKKKKKSKKEPQNFQDYCLQEPAEDKSKKNEKNLDRENCCEYETEKPTKPVEKKRKKRNIQESLENNLEKTNSEVDDLVNDRMQESCTKKSKKNKNKPEQESFQQNEVQDLDKDSAHAQAGKTTKKKKNKAEGKSFSGDELESEPQTFKKAKKYKTCDIAEPTEFKLDETKSEIKDLENYCIREPAEKKLQTNENTPDKSKLSEHKKESGVIEVVDTILGETKSKKKKDKSRNKIETDLSNRNKTAKKKKLEEPEAVVVAGTEADLIQESVGKKDKKELNAVIEITDSDSDECANTIIQPATKDQKEKKKSKKSKEETSDDKETSTISNPTVSDGKPPAKKSKKEVSSSAKNMFQCDVELQAASLEELEKKYQAFNNYPISSFCAEKFRNITFNKFKDSSLPHIEGYGLSTNLQLDIYVNKYDEERITNLWKSALNKYEQVGKPKKTYKKFIKQSLTARKEKQKAPKLYIKTWQRKNAFQLV